MNRNLPGNVTRRSRRQSDEYRSRLALRDRCGKEFYGSAVIDYYELTRQYIGRLDRNLTPEMGALTLDVAFCSPVCLCAHVSKHIAPDVADDLMDDD